MMMVLFLVTAILVCTLPFVPALMEWHFKTDAEPLVVIRAQDTNIRHFAHTFFDQIQELFEREAIDPTQPPAPYAGEFRPQEPFHFLGENSTPRWSEAERRNRVIPMLLVATGDLLLEAGFVYEREVYCGGKLYAGSSSTFRAVYAGTDLILGDDCTVARWLHSQGHVHIGTNCVVYGRISSTSSITLGLGTRFERLNAEKIRFASDTPIRPGKRLFAEELLDWRQPESLLVMDTETLLSRTHLHIDAERRVKNNLVVKGELRLGSDCHVSGSLKAKKSLRVGERATVRGSLVCEGPIRIGRNSIVKGPVISEQEIVIAAGSMIGTPGEPTTVTAPRILVEPASEVSGTLWAAEFGQVQPEQNSNELSQS